MRRRTLVWVAVLLSGAIGCGSDDEGGSGQVGNRSTPTATATMVDRTATRAPDSPTATATDTPTSTATPTITPTATPTPTPTQTPLPPEISHFGVARSDDVPQPPDLFDDEGRPVFVRLFGSGMTLIVEAKRGAGGPPVALEAYDPGGGAPGLQVLVSRALGNGSEEVCDYDPMDSSVTGGVPATDPPEFSDAPSVVGAMNDLGCRVNDGSGVPEGRPKDLACTQRNGEFEVVDSSSEVQFCLPIASAWAFPLGDTVVAARVRDERGALSEVKEIVIRVLDPTPSNCAFGVRELTLARPASMLLGSAMPGIDVSDDPWLEGPLRLCGGQEIGSGVYQLRLADDAVFGFKVIDNSTLCVKLFAQNSAGTIDCNGGSAHDVRITQELPDPRVVETGIGLDAGTGAATLRASMAVMNLPAGSSVEDCTTIELASGFTSVFTTAHASALLTNTSQGEDASIEVTGANFDCSRWTETDSPGTFVSLLPVTGTPAGDIVNAFVLAD